MDFENFDEAAFSPQQTSLNRFCKGFAVLLLATAVLPIDRFADAPVNVWDRFGVASTLDTIRLVLPAVLGLVFGYLGFVSRHALKVKSGIVVLGLLLLVLVGVNPFEVLRVVLPPISGSAASLDRIALLTGVSLPMVDGEYFPREDTLHLILLGLGLATLAVGGRYRDLLQSSRLGSYVMMGAAALIVAYYLVPYGGAPAAKRNLDLYRGFYQVAGKLVEHGELMEKSVEELDDLTLITTEEKLALRADAREVKMAGQLKISAVYFMFVYFVPLLLVLLSLPAWKESRYKGHKATFGRLAGWGASVYLLAVLLPLLFKEGMRTTGPGFLPNLRSYFIFAAVFVGITIAGSILLKEVVEPDKDDEGLHDDPLAWKEAA